MNEKLISKSLVYLSAAAVIILFFSCSTPKEAVKAPEPKPLVATNIAVETPPVVEEPETDPIEKYQPELDKMGYSGYMYKFIRPNKAVREEWGGNHLSRLKEIIDALPDGYILVVNGHTDKQKTTKTPKTISQYNLGLLRAQFFYKDILKPAGISSSDVKIISSGDEELIEGISPGDEKNRRVTLHIEKKSE